MHVEFEGGANRAVWCPPDAFGGGGDTLKYLKLGVTAGRSFNGWRLKRQLHAEGFDPVTIDAAVEAVKAGRDPEPILYTAKERQRILSERDKIRQSPPPVHGSARFATEHDLTTKRLFTPNTGDGLALGYANQKQVVWKGESHLLTIAPTRTGKSTMQIVPNLLQYKGSCVVLDPKGELLALTGQWREQNVGPVYVMDPFGQVKDRTTHAFNPLDYVTTSQDATKLAEMIYPRGQDDKQRFFDNEAIGFLAGVIEFAALYAPPSFKNFGTIRDTISSLSKDFYGLLKAMSDPIMPPGIRNAALTVQTKTFDTGKPRLIDSISQHMRIWDTQGLRDATKQSDFDFRSLKDTPATVYLILPFEEIKPHSVYVKLIFASALDAMLHNKAKPKIPVLFVLDEFLALDADDRFVDALRTHASAGVRLWFFLQDLPTLEQKYPTTWKSFLQVETKTFFGTDDPFTAELISKYLGDLTVAYELPNTSASNSAGGGSSGSYSLSDNIQLSARKLLTPDEVIELMGQHISKDERIAIHFMRDLRPVKARLSSWYLNSKLSERTQL